MSNSCHCLRTLFDDVVEHNQTQTDLDLRKGKATACKLRGSPPPGLWASLKFDSETKQRDRAEIHVFNPEEFDRHSPNGKKIYFEILVEDTGKGCRIVPKWTRPLYAQDDLRAFCSNLVYQLVKYVNASQASSPIVV